MAKLISGNYGTHLGALIACMQRTKGDVLELGIGYSSTPYLHYQCEIDKRNLISMENDNGWIRRFAYSDFYMHNFDRSKYHTFVYVENWEDAEIEKPWDVVLVDHSPSSRRKEEVKRLANHAKYIIIHDSNKEFEKEYRYSEIYPLFKHRKVWTGDDRHTDVLSNFVNLDNLWD